LKAAINAERATVRFLFAASNASSGDRPVNTLAPIEDILVAWAGAKGLEWRSEYLLADSKVITVGAGARVPVSFRVYGLGTDQYRIDIKQEFSSDEPYKIKIVIGPNDELPQAFDRMFRLAEMWVKEAEHQP